MFAFGVGFHSNQGHAGIPSSSKQVMVFIQESSVSSPSSMATVLAFFPNKAVLVQAQQSVLIPNLGTAGCSISSISLARNKHNSATLPSKAVQTHAKQCWLSSQARQCRHSRASPSTTVLAFIPGIAVQAQAHQCWLSFHARQCRHSSASPSTTVLAFIQGIAVQAQAHQCWLSSKA